MTLPANIGASLRGLRLVRGMSLADVARLARISVDDLDQIEKGHARPRLTGVRAVLEAMGYRQRDLHLIQALRERR
jgi:transcriptional regulator with XRE-family HTH domain